LRYETSKLALGDLKGNQITVVIRDINQTQIGDIKRRLETLQTNGFYNYYAFKKFVTVHTHEIGVLMLQSDWKSVVNSILSSQTSDSDGTKAARECWIQTHDAALSLALFPKEFVTERSILNFFVSNDNIDDYYGAVEAIPKLLRLVYIRSFQVFYLIIFYKRALYSITCSMLELRRTDTTR